MSRFGAIPVDAPAQPAQQAAPRSRFGAIPVEQPAAPQPAAVAAQPAARLDPESVVASPEERPRGSLFNLGSDFSRQAFGPGILGAIRGEVPVLQGIDNSLRAADAQLGGAARDMFAGEASASRYVAQQAGGEQVQLRDGSPGVRLPNGQTYRINDPGLDVNDVANASGNIAAFYSPAAWASRIGQAKNLGVVSRGALQGGTAATTDLGLQTVANAGDLSQIDLQRTGFAAAGGAGGEALGQGLARLMAGARQVIRSGGSTQDAARQLAQRAGIANPTFDQTRRLASAMDEIEVGADPRAILGREEFGFLYTQGQRMAPTDPRRFDTLAREELIRQQAGGENAIRRATAENTDRLGEAIDTIGQRLGAPPAANPAELAQGAATRVGQQADELRGQVGAAYDRVRDLPTAAVSRESVMTVPTRLRAAVREFDINPTTTPGAARMLAQIDEATRQIDALPPEATGVTMRAVETQRRIIGRMIDGAQNNADRAAMNVMKREYDQWVDDAVDSALVSGDAEALAVIKEARGLRAQFARRFEGGNTDADRFIQDMVAGRRTPEELVSTILGAGQVSKNAGARFVDRLRLAVQDDPAVMGSLRSAHFLRLARGADGQPLQPGQIVRNIRATEYSNQSIVRALYSPEEWANARRLANALEPMLARGDMAKSSGTAERLMRYFGASTGGLPIVGDLIQGVRSVRASGAAERAINAPVRAPARSLPAVNAASSAAGQERAR
jgi:hypothetical protein